MARAPAYVKTGFLPLVLSRLRGRLQRGYRLGADEVRARVPPCFFMNADGWEIVALPAKQGKRQGLGPL